MATVDRELLRALGHILRPLSNRIASLISRATVQLTDDGKMLQMLQLGAVADEIVEDAEHHQAYGFSSVPLAGAEAVVVFPNGDRGHPLVVAVSDRRHRPTGMEPGEVTVHNNTGASVRLTKDGDIVMTPASGRKVLVQDAGTPGKLVPLSEFLNHSHASFGGPPVEIVPSVPPGFDGTDLLESE